MEEEEKEDGGEGVSRRRMEEEEDGYKRLLLNIKKLKLWFIMKIKIIFVLQNITVWSFQFTDNTTGFQT